MCRHDVYDDPSVDGTVEIADIAWLQVARITAGRHRVVMSRRPHSHPRLRSFCRSPAKA